MKLIKKVSSDTKKRKDGKDFHPIRYFIVTDNGKKILIKPVFKEDYSRLDMVSDYVR